MTNRLMLATSQVDKNTEKRIADAFDEKGITWWHWLPNMWIVVSKENISANEVRDLLYDLNNKFEMLVMPLDRVSNWSGAFTENKNFNKWMDENWNIS